MADRRPPRASFRVRRRLLLGVAVLLAVPAGLWTAAQLTASTAVQRVSTAGGQLRYAADEPQREAGLLRLIQAGRADPLSLNPRHEPLDREPLGLPLPPIEDLQPGSRYRIADGSWTDELSYWRCPGHVAIETVLAHYERAAAPLGFRPIRYPPV